MSIARSPFPPINFKTRFPALDGIRALAVTMVFALHYGGGTHGGLLLRAFNRVRGYGGYGVDVFFVLSGFLITGILYDTRTDSHFFKRFFARRSVRIFPIVYLLFFILATLTPILHYEWRWKQAYFLVYLGNLFGNNDFSLYELPSVIFPGAKAGLAHLWSLCVEEQFYMIWPIVVFVIPNRVKLLWTCAALCVFSLLSRVWLVLFCTHYQAFAWGLRSLPFRLDDLLFGAILALLLRGTSADKIQRSMKWVFLAGMAAAVTVDRLSPQWDSVWMLTIGMTFIGLASMGLIGMTLHPQSWAHKLFHLSGLRVLGKYSYGFYVWHAVWYSAWLKLLIFSSNYFHSLAVGGLITLPLAFGTTFLVAKLSYDLFEVRFLKLKRKFEYDSELRTHQTAFAADGN